MEDRPAPRTITFLRFNLFVGDRQEIAAWIIGLASRRGAVVAHMNFYNYWLATRKDSGASLLHRHYQLIFEGIAMKLAALLLGYGWLPDNNGTDLFPLVMTHAAANGLRIYMLGAAPDVLQRAAMTLQQQYPRIVLCGTRHGYFNAPDIPDIVSEVERAHVDILLLSCGSSMHTEFAGSHRDALKAGLIWNVGGLFDFLGGRTPRAPVWMRALRLEWLFRLLIKPREKAYRIFVIAPRFLLLVLRARFGSRADATDFRAHSGPENRTPTRP